MQNVMITQSRSGHPSNCPVIVAANIIRRLENLKSKGLCVLDDFGIFFFENDEGNLDSISNKELLKCIRSFINLFIDSKLLGFSSKEIGLHSIRSSAAMAMHLSGIPVCIIMLIGRWASDAFLNYIRTQVEQFGSNIAAAMLQCPIYHHVIRDEIPQIDDPNSLAARFGVGFPGQSSISPFRIWAS
jgi:hypothetical protein